MSKTDIKRVLSGLRGFENPNPELEQYVTPPELAAELGHTASLNKDLGEVQDLGCGTGMLAIAAAVAGADQVTGYDVDEAALDIARQNSTEADVREACQFQAKDVEDIGNVDGTVVSNPPFSMHSERFDDFIDVVARSQVFYVVAPTNAETGLKALDDRFELEAVRHTVSLPPTMRFHTEAGHRIEVDLWRGTR
nr:MAG: putative RNA methylase [Candidatus Nanosalinarum sp. J07AB56]